MLRTRLNDALKQAMKAREERAVSTLRLILAALKDRDICARGKGNDDGIGEDEILAMLQTMIKQRKEAIQLYEQGGRLELAQQEQDEIRIIESFMPRQLSEDETKSAITAAIQELGCCGVKDMGRTMALLKQRYAGQMDFARASGMVRQHLS
ncbi:MAG: GatB/YqeY domain-containing protein [Alphaproteobacteria bacterium]|nr:GatB/YqeY domain-containing protein [Alphaproteobacteria bacterium]